MSKKDKIAQKSKKMGVFPKSFEIKITLLILKKIILLGALFLIVYFFMKILLIPMAISLFGFLLELFQDYLLLEMPYKFFGTLAILFIVFRIFSAVINILLLISKSFVEEWRK